MHSTSVPLRLSCRILLAVAWVAACGGESTEPEGFTPAASISIQGAADTLLLGEVRTLRAILRDSGGRLIPDRPVAWISASPEVVAVSEGGVLTPLKGGTAEITATSGAASSSLTVAARRLQYEQIYPGGAFGCGLEATGAAWCWGNVGSSGTGNGSSDQTRSDLPRRAATGSLFRSLALGEAFACGIRIAGDVVCWGENDSGQLGKGTTAPGTTPQIVGGITGALDLAAGAKHACAVTAAAAWCWGANESGQLGDGTRLQRENPVQVTGLGGIASITAGYSHTCALSGGRPFCWGNDDLAQLGHDTTYHRSVPVRAGAVAGGEPVYQAVTARDQHTCASGGTGKAYCWGTLVSATTSHGVERHFSPIEQAGGRQFARLFDGTVFQCGLDAGEELWCWAFDFAPTRFPIGQQIGDAAISYSHVCALDPGATAHCWMPGQSATVPVDAPPLTAIAGSGNTICGLDATGALWCWNAWNVIDARIPAMPEATGKVFSSIWDGEVVCVLTSSGDAGCMSSDYFDADYEDGPVGFGFVSISAGLDHACGLAASGIASCWGKNGLGQLGDNSYVDRPTPAPVAGGHMFTSVAAASYHTCGLTIDGEAFCWGSGRGGQMGDGNQVDSPLPVPVDGVPTIEQLDAGGGWFSCGLDAAGAAHCWPVSHQLEVRTVTGPAPFEGISAGQGHACAIAVSGAAMCWGRNGAGVFGNGQSGYDEVWVPQGVSGNVAFRTIAAGGRTCGISTAGNAYCWGDNSWGSLGSPDAGNSEWASVPMRLYGQE